MSYGQFSLSNSRWLCTQKIERSYRVGQNTKVSPLVMNNLRANDSNCRSDKLNTGCTVYSSVCEFDIGKHLLRERKSKKSIHILKPK